MIMIEKIEVISSNIKYVSYDEVNQQLKVGFEAPETELQYARVYRYSSLPMDVYKALMASASKGEYLCKNIAFEYPYEYLGIEGDLA